MLVLKMTLRRIFANKLCLLFLVLFPAVTFMLITFQTNNASFDEGDSRVFQGITIAVADNDNTAISRELIRQLDLRYVVEEISSDEINSTLSESNATPWALEIEEGFGEDVITGNTNLQTLQSRTITMTDIARLVTMQATNITRSMMLLPLTGDEQSDAQIIEDWTEATQMEISPVEVPLGWEGIAQWLSMYGFVSLLTAYFIVRTLAEDKFKGMPDRISALPVSTRSFLTQGTIAAFLATEVSVILTLLVIHYTITPLSNPIVLLIVMSLYNLFAVSLVFTMSTIAKTLAGVAMAVSMFGTLLAMLGGLF